MRRLCTNPSLVFDTGAFDLASPKTKDDLLRTSVLDGGDSLWSVGPVPDWNKANPGELFFDQVAELEKLIPGERSKGHCLEESWMANVEFLKSEEIINNWAGPEEKLDGINQADNICAGAQNVGLDICGGREVGSIDFVMIEQQTQEHGLNGEATEAALFDVTQDSPSSVGSSCSDEVSDKRLRNNKASRKFRRARKERNHSLFARASKLEQENQALKLQVNQMLQEVISLRSMFSNNTFPGQV